MKGVKYLVLFLVLSNTGVVMLGSIGVTDTIGIDPSACGGEAAEDISDTAGQAGEGSSNSELDLLVKFYNALAGTLEDIFVNIQPAAQTVKCNLPSQYHPVANWVFGGTTVLTGFALAGYLRGVII